MAEPFLGEIKLVSFNYAPHGWAVCAGQTLQISQNTALFSLIGTFYGGDGVRTFQLPDLRGRAIIHRGPAISNNQVGVVGGQETTTLNVSQIPPHTHGAPASAAAADASSPAGEYLAVSPIGLGYVYGGETNPTTMSPGAIQPAGGSQPHENRMPYLAMT